MNTYTLPFGSITIMEKNIAEVIIADGIEMDYKKVEYFHRFLKTHFENSFSILVNNKHSYSYTFDAQKRLGNIEEITAIGFVNYTSGAELSMQTIKQISKKTLNLKSFITRDEALNWIVEQ